MKIAQSCGWKNRRDPERDADSNLISTVARSRPMEARAPAIKAANSGLCNYWAQRSQNRCRGVNEHDWSRLDQGRCLTGVVRVFWWPIRGLLQ